MLEDENCSKIKVKWVMIQSMFDRFWGGFGVHFGAIWGLKIDQKSILKTFGKYDGFSITKILDFLGLSRFAGRTSHRDRVTGEG